ncbi:Flavin-linked sulfhydryl oxidase of the mitochondrial IMS [Coemansia javaensis]|uniref:Sulfhydryl oxidase n=1 Tax=Coemansia javaensis TaxID=2761396 RepID=A0A9W8LJ20_9FUNG|nr:Flavin-linked sulfhydryl oxidase of the mitochondrial IMS [Coemansia javaensis]
MAGGGGGGEQQQEPCRVCDSFKSWRRHEAKAHRTSTKAAKANSTADDCPPDSQTLGRATWTFLHTMAAYYPERASEKQQDTMRALLSSFSQFYPCGRCASHLREEMARDPPQVATRSALSLWLCQTHNKVNEMLGKDIFDCSKVDERWRDGPSDGRCSWAQDVEY